MAPLFLGSLRTTATTYWTRDAWLHPSLPRIAVYIIFFALLAMAISVDGDAFPPRLLQLTQLAQIEQLMSGSPGTESMRGALANGVSEALFTPEEFLSAKAKIWKNFRERAHQCGRSAGLAPGQNSNPENSKAKNSKYDACVELARRERRAAQAMAKARIAPTPHSAEDRSVALY